MNNLARHCLPLAPIPILRLKQSRDFPRKSLGIHNILLFPRKYVNQNTSESDASNVYVVFKKHDAPLRRIQADQWLITVICMALFSSKVSLYYGIIQRLLLYIEWRSRSSDKTKQDPRLTFPCAVIFLLRICSKHTNVKNTTYYTSGLFCEFNEPGNISWSRTLQFWIPHWNLFHSKLILCINVFLTLWPEEQLLKLSSKRPF
jgi:hypothetical protein